MAKCKTSLAAAVHTAARNAPPPDERPVPGPGPAPPAATSSGSRSRARRQSQDESKGETRGVLIQVPIDTWRELRHLTVDEDRSLQALGLEALEALLASRRGTS